MEALLSLLTENWIAIAFIIVSVVVAAVVYVWLLARIERRVKKAWLEVYETFLSRADKVPLLVELVREEAREAGESSDSLEQLLQALIVARAATAGMSRPSAQKSATEKAFEEALRRVLDDVSSHASLKKNAMFLGLLQEFSAWSPRLQMAISAYVRTLRTYRRLALGGMPEGYGAFEY